MKLVILGAGALGGLVAAALDGAIAVTAGTGRHAALRASGARPTTEWPALDGVDALLLALPGSDAQREAVERLAAERPPSRVVMIGTTAFHAPYQGRIHPGSPPGDAPRAGPARRAEEALRAWAPDAVVIRCGGLWTEGRGPQAAFARTGSAPEGPPDAALPLIRYEHAAALAVAALTEADPPRVVLGVAEAPSRRAYYEALAARLGVPVPAFGPPLGGTATFEDPWAAARLPR